MSVFSILILVVLLFVILTLLKGPAITKIPENLTDEDIKNVYKNGQKILAIKYYRSLHKVSLKEAKEAVESMIEK